MSLLKFQVIKGSRTLQNIYGDSHGHLCYLKSRLYLKKNSKLYSKQQNHNISNKWQRQQRTERGQQEKKNTHTSIWIYISLRFQFQICALCIILCYKILSLFQSISLNVWIQVYSFVCRTIRYTIYGMQNFVFFIVFPSLLEKENRLLFVKWKRAKRENHLNNSNSRNSDSNNNYSFLCVCVFFVHSARHIMYHGLCSALLILFRLSSFTEHIFSHIRIPTY